MCQSTEDGGRRCPSHLRKMPLDAFGPSDAHWIVDPLEEPLNQAAAVLSEFGDEVGAAALNLAAKVKGAEPGITADVVALTPPGWRNHGLEHRAKGPQSMARKFAFLAMTTGEDLDRIAATFHDALRYTCIAPHGEGFESGVTTMLRSLVGQRYALDRMDNSFLPGNTYLGFHAVLGDQVVYFEIQFHTEDSYAIKKGTDALYRVARDPQSTPSEIRRAREDMKRLSQSIQIPEGLDVIDINGIKPTPKKRGR